MSYLLSFSSSLSILANRYAYKLICINDFEFNKTNVNLQYTKNIWDITRNLYTIVKQVLL